MPKKSKTQEYLESKVIYKHDGVIDFNKLWKDDDEVELDPKIANQYATQVWPAVQS